jgi:energy-coupling factor transporter transmembrane protein EcfT
MDHLFLFSILGGIALVFLVVIARIALRWAVRFAVVCLLLVAVLGCAAWWWFKPGSQTEPKPRPTSTRRTASDQR